MSSVLSVELREYVRDVAFYACFADRQLIGNLFVGVPAGNQSQHVNFARGQVVAWMIHKFYGNLLRYSPLSGMDSSNGFQEFPMDLSFQQVTSCSGLDGSQHLNIAAIGC